MIIDAHVHVAKGIVEFYEGIIKVKCNMNVKSLLRDMKVAGIDKAIACGLPHDPAKANNDFIAKLVEAYPERLVGFAIVNPMQGERAIEELDRAVKDLGLKGLKLDPNSQHFYPNDPKIYPLVKRAEKLRIPIEIHSGFNEVGPLKYANPIFFDDLAMSFPKLTLIMLHSVGSSWGRFPHLSQQAIMVALKNRNILLETSYTDDRTVIEAVKILGSERVVFGSDFPLNKPAYEIERIKRLRWMYPGLIDDEDLKMILGENMKNILEIKTE